MVDLDKKILLITGGTIKIDFVRDYLTKNQFDIVIGIDSGLNGIFELSIFPDYIVGDFDSVSSDIIEKYVNGEILKNGKKPMIKKYSSHKDYTDTQIGVELAISLGATSITILGGTGTRLDHLIGNVNLLLLPLKKKIKASIIDSNNKVYLLDSNTKIVKKDLFAPYYSLLPLTKEVKGLTLKGFKYPLVEKDLSIGDSLGISNKVCEDIAYIEFSEGILIAIETRD